MENKRPFSIVIATYRGAKTIGQTLDSLLAQSEKMNYEVVVVIDGPHEPTKKLIENYKKRFDAKSVELVIKQLNTNQGRFGARFIGAQAARTEQLLILDDRVYLSPDYFDNLKTTQQGLMLANVIEDYEEQANMISTTLTLLRRLIYGNKWGNSFKDYYITSNNFENSPKGTASLWIPKTTFINACQNLSRPKNSRYVNEDTKILRYIVDQGEDIFRTSKLRIYYKPRNSFTASARHLFERGPRFVDYYIRVNSKFFPLLVLIYLAPIIIIGLLIINPLYLIYLLAISAGAILIAALSLSHNASEFYRMVLGIPIVCIVFSSGVIYGTLLKVRN